MSATSYLPDSFISSVVSMANDWRAQGATISAEDLLAIWLSESGVTAHALNPDGIHAGLNQMGSGERAATGFPGGVDDWRSLSESEQLPFVRRYYEGDVRSFCNGDFSCLADLGSLYLINFMPARMSHAKEPDFVLARQGDGVYEQNAAIDFDRKGFIVVGDLTPFAARAQTSNPGKWSELQARVRSAGGGPSPPSFAPSLSPGWWRTPLALSLVGLSAGAILVASGKAPPTILRFARFARKVIPV